ncbi:BglG family transcription antiterminator LicT [Metabacillus litoralis]|jgi:beta-glucoside operon transcriptional antiterminator|uniref:BglG family transcription antiterminator LicT n=1 Tax=Metabacillus litoralis TaxID=152268 RepID=UPI00203F9E1B|nr:PRD domain-containing protein [Metabacillus litoralis]MCM3651518.1 PRD domain-containing protein [Metabacillus litoralis]
MLIKKIFNNNVILTEDDKQQEIVVMGRGLAFQKKIGDKIDETKIEKTFTIHSKNVSDKLSQLLEEIPLEHFELSNDIIELAKKELGSQLNESIYLSLTDHIHFALTRIQEGLIIKNALLWEVKKFYKDEYKVAKQAIRMIEERTEIRIPEDESASIALHLFNARQDSVGMEQTMVMTKIVNEIITIVKYHFGITFDEDSMNYSRFITHLRYFAYRIQRGELSHEGGDSLFDQVIKQYPDAYQCTLKVQTYLQSNYNVKMTKDEMVYFMIHIHRVSNREKKA